MARSPAESSRAFHPPRHSYPKRRGASLPAALQGGCAALLLAAPGFLFAGPYAPGAGQAGSTAIHRGDARFTAWASRAAAYQPGANVLPQWRDTAKCLGRAGDDPLHITCLGDGGSITLSFPGFVHDGPGPDFAVFENGFGDSFLELAWVEVSADGVNFVRFPNHSLTPSPVPSFGGMDPTNVSGLGSKYRQPYGEPYDLADVGLTSVSHVRLVDVVGDGTARDSENRVIYDPYPSDQSAGFDLDAVGVLNLRAWRSEQVAAVDPAGLNAFAFAHLPDGRFLLGGQGKLWRQNAWGAAAKTALGTGGVEFDPSFLAVRDATSALLGAGGGFFGDTGVHTFDPTAAAASLTAAPLAEMQNYSGVWWRHPVSGRAGWIVGGTNGPTGKHTLTFVSADGTRTGPVTQELCAFSSGLAADGQGNVFAALYELPGGPTEADAEKVLRFSADRIDTAVAAVLAGTPAPAPRGDAAFVYQFDTASSLAVDAAGRLWAGGFKSSRVQVYDPATGGVLRLTPDHGAYPAGTDVTYHVATFVRDGAPYAAFLALDEAGTPNAPVWHGVAPLDAVAVPNTLATWRAFRFGAERVTPENEAELWGDNTDFDHDGLPNLLEYAFARDPLVPEKTAVTAVARESNRLTIQFTRDPLNTDLSYAVEAADTPDGAWQVLARSSAGAPAEAVAGSGAVVYETTVAETAPRLVSVRDSAAVSTKTKRFLRVRVTVITP